MRERERERGTIRERERGTMRQRERGMVHDQKEIERVRMGGVVDDPCKSSNSKSPINMPKYSATLSVELQVLGLTGVWGEREAVCCRDV